MPVAEVPAGAGTADVTESSNAFALPTGASCIGEGEDMASLLVVHQCWIDGYKDFNFMRASAVVKRQSTFMAS